MQEGTILWALRPDPNRSLFAGESPTEQFIRAIEVLVSKVSCEDNPAGDLLSALALQRETRGDRFDSRVHAAVDGLITWLREREVSPSSYDQGMTLLYLLHDGYHETLTTIEAGHEAHKPALDYLVAVFAPD